MKNSNQHSNNGNYKKFFAMLGLLFVILYINTYEIEHVYFSLTRFYMVCLGISSMAVIMLLFISTLGFVRTKTPIIGNVLWMKGITLHHSIAILTSDRRGLKYLEVNKLADDIIKAQKK